MYNSLQSHGLQPTRLLCPWNFPGKNTGKSKCQSLSHVRLFVTPRRVARLALCPWNSPCKNAGVGSHSLLQGIFLTQGSNSCLLHCSQSLYSLSHQGSPIGKISFIKIGKRFEQSFTMVVVQSLSRLTLVTHGQQPARLLCPQYSPGKNTGVGYHFLLQGIFPDPRINLESPALQADSLTLTTVSPKDTGVGCHFLLQGIVGYKLPEYRRHVSTYSEFLSKTDGLIGSKHLKKSLSNNSQTSKLTMECLQQLHMTENFPQIFGIYLKQPLIPHFMQSVGPGSQDTGWDCKAPLPPAQGDGNLLLAP